MAIYLIRHRWTHRELAAIEAPSHARALEWAARSRISLMDVDLAGITLQGAFLAEADLRGAGLAGADLSGCYLRGADLRGADLRGARLTGAFLNAADFRGADLREADLSRAELRGANLVGADLREADLDGARLDGAICEWRWATIPTELLRCQQGPSTVDYGLVLALALHDDPAPWSWMRRIAGRGRLTEAALGILAGWIRDGDNAPDLLRSLAADAAIPRDDWDSIPETSTDLQPEPRMMWTRRK